MARKPREVVAGPRVEEFPVIGSRSLLTIGPSSVAWEDLVGFGVSVDAERTFPGAIVRLQPPLGSSDADVARVVAWVRSRGVVAVRTMPRRRGIRYRDPKPANAIQRPQDRIREVVALVVSEMTVDKSPLTAFVEQVMARCAL
jgi:hypothetical protein